MTRRSRRRLRTAPVAGVTQDIGASRLRLLGVVIVCAKVSLVPVVFDYSADFPFPVVEAPVSLGLAYALGGAIAVIRSLAHRLVLDPPRYAVVT